MNAGLALAKGENAAAQAAGAMTGETVGILSHSLYGKTPEELTEAEKQNISAWATLASGIAGGLISDNSAGVANAAQAGKVVVENNYLTNKDVLDMRQALIEASKTGSDKEIIYAKYREISERRRQEAIAEGKEGKIPETIASWESTKTGIDQADALKWIAWLDSLSAEDRRQLVNFVKNENEQSAQSIFNSATFGARVALGSKEGFDSIGMSGPSKDSGITVRTTAIRGNENNKKPTPEQDNKESQNKIDPGKQVSGSKGKDVSEIGRIDYPNGINFDIEKLPGHVSKVDGFSQKRGISGGHNSDSFYKAVTDNSIKILSETLTDVKGITHITYQIPTKDRTGKLDGGYKNEIFEKTVYDPKVFSDQRILDLGQKASAKGYKEAMNSRDGQATATVDGVSFRIYIDKTTGKVRNFHPN